MRSVIRVLFIEDSSDDVQLELAALRETGLVLEHHVVETAADVRAALAGGNWQVIICDYVMPELNGLDALRLCKQLAPDVPFILVSGTVGEDVAVDAMRAGAEDYVLKENLTRLASAVERELRETETRRAGRLSRQGLRLMADVGAALSSSLDPIAILEKLPLLLLGDFAERCEINVQQEKPGQGHTASAGGLADSGDALAHALELPLRVQDRSIGTVRLFRRTPHEPLEIRILEELCGRIAISLDNARLYGQAQRAVRIRDEFLSVASHELRTPLTALQLQMQALSQMAAKKRAEWADDRLVARLHRGSQSVERLGQLVETLLDVSRISTGRLQLDLENFDLIRLIEELIERVSDDARRAGCELRVESPANLVGRWDRLRLDQVLTNLLSNAIKYGGAKPVSIRVTGSPREEEGPVVIEVIDQGIGIPAEDLERIFGRFERAVSSNHYGGLGLGLFITRQIVEAHGGTVVARPTSTGGAAFTVELPRRCATSSVEARDLSDGEPLAALLPRAAGTPPRTDVPGRDELHSFIQEVKDYAIFMLDAQGRVLTWNDGARLIKGYRADEIIGKSHETFYSAEDRARGKPGQLLAQAVSGGRVEDEGWRVRKDGSRVWADVVIVAAHDEEGRLRGFMKVTRDLTARRQAEELLRESEERLRLLVEGVKDYAIFMLEPHGRIATWNKGAERMKGYQAAEVLGKHFSMFYPAVDVAARRPDRQLEVALAEGRHEEEGWRVRKTGERFWANAVITAVHDPITGEHRGFAKVTRDLTERQRIEEHARLAEEQAQAERLRSMEAENALKLRDEFISVAAHELRTPLTALQLKVQGVAHALRSAGMQGGQAAGDGFVMRLGDRLEGAYRQVARLATLVERLLDVSRIVRGALSLEPEPADMVALAGQVLDDFREPAQQAGCELRFQAPAQLTGTWDRARMEQVMVNLVSNALKYGGGKPVTVQLEAIDGGAKLTVADQGIGIDPQDRERIFARFERAASPRHYGGLGLGLYVTRSIIEAHGGSVQVFSTPGAGSTFVVEVPREPPGPPTSRRAPVESRS